MLDLTSNRYVPGPGNYEVRDNRFKSPSFVFGNPSSRNLSEGDKNGKRNHRIDNGPGPGSYTRKDEFGKTAKGFSILGRFSTIKNQLETNPGPGTYDLDRFSKTHGPSFSLKGATSEDPIMREKKSTPAPGAYNPKDDYVRKGISRIAFGPRPPKPPKSDAKTDGPGPGSYKIPSTLQTSKGAVMIGSKGNIGLNGSKSQTNFSVRHESPGPGAYLKTTTSFLSGNKGALIVGKPKHTDKAKTEHSPGPGAYDVDKKVFDNDTQKISFGHGERFKLAAMPNKETPGPGTYSYSNDIYKSKGRIK